MYRNRSIVKNMDFFYLPFRS
uniref:Uncharacterized protein n=1 Tax=Anguilla anguilla TaxID=7936 RepID=A0A0E9R2G0_ANGAN